MVTRDTYCRKFFHTFAPRLLVCTLMPSKLLRSMKPLQPTWIGYVFTRNWARRMSSSRSKYRICFLWHASTKFDSWHTVSSRRATNLVESFQTTMSGLRSLLAICGGKVKGSWSGRSAIIELPEGRWSLSRLKITWRT